MVLAPTPPELLARARSDLRMGLPIVLTRGPEAVLAAPAETLGAERLRAMLGEVSVLALTRRRAETLKIRVYDGDIARIRPDPGLGLAGLQAIIDPADDLTAPMKGPFAALREGDPTLARAALLLMKSARLVPAALLAPAAQVGAGLTRVEAASLTLAAPALDPVISAGLPMAAAPGRLHLYRPGDGGDEHYAVEIGRPDRKAPVLVRLHSACFTGDVLGSLKCDCGPQLNGALAQMAEAGAGVLLYLNQEGRGIGLANKLRAYSLQDQGFDTVEANHRLGFEDDERDFRIGAALLKRMGIGQVRLLTNNPRKVEMLESCGIEVVERVPLAVGLNPLNAGYLRTKAQKSGHLL
jgi:GTP cyclohydrolase II